MTETEVRLDIGCGPNKQPGYIGVDLFKGAGVDIVSNLDRCLPFAESSVDDIYCSHFMEHAQDPVAVLKEFLRVVRDGGRILIRVPHYTNPYAHHFTHKTYWSSFSMDQNYLDYYVDPRLVLRRRAVKLVWWKPLDPLLNRLANASLSLYERVLARFVHAWEIEFELIKKSARRAGPPTL